MQTDIGTFTVELLPKYAPVTVNNFVFLAGYHYFDGIVFHRVIPGFMNQGGDPTATGSGGPGYQFKDELPSASSAYDTGAVAMANSGPNTNGSQFFIVVPGGGERAEPELQCLRPGHVGHEHRREDQLRRDIGRNPQRVPQDRQGDRHRVLSGS